MRLLSVLLLTVPSLASATCPLTTPIGVGVSAAVGSTLTSTDDYDQGCGVGGGYGSPDEAFEFTAPVDGFYTFDTEGSDFDTVLQLLASDCTTAIECNDDGGTNLLSSIGLNLLAGETVVVVVSGYSDATGNFVLNVAQEPWYELSCDVYDDLGSALGFDVGTVDTCGETDDVTASCTVSSGNDALLTWTAPTAGVFTFSTAASPFDTVLSVWEAGCGEEIACNDDYAHGTSSVTLTMAAGEEVELRVDSYSSFSCGEARIHVLDENCLDENMNARCDADDAVLTVSAATVGAPVTFQVSNALPFSDVSFSLASQSTNITPTTCSPSSPNDCLYLVDPRPMGTVVADGAGNASLSFTVPARFAGRTIHAQAVSTDGVDVRATDNVSTTVAP